MSAVTNSQPRIRRVVDTEAGHRPEQLPLPLLFLEEAIFPSAPAPIEQILPQAPAQKEDLRSELAIALDASGEYRLPRTSRAGMIVELMARSLHREGDTHFPGWDIRMNFSWNQSGRTRDGAEVSRDHDERWTELLENDPSIFHRACEKALTPWVEEHVDLLEMDGELECSFELMEPGRDTLLLKSFAGRVMEFAGRAQWAEFVKSLDDAQLAETWMAFRVLDADLSRKQRAELMAGEYNTIRQEMEADWDLEIDSLEF